MKKYISEDLTTAGDRIQSKMKAVSIQSDLLFVWTYKHILKMKVAA
jgi:hypothetical protein